MSPLRPPAAALVAGLALLTGCGGAAPVTEPADPPTATTASSQSPPPAAPIPLGDPPDAAGAAGGDPGPAGGCPLFPADSVWHSHLWPARHAAGSGDDPALPSMGLRLRLKSSVDISGLPEQARVLARAMQTHGLIVADNGSAWYISGSPDERWNNDALQALNSLRGNAFEAVDASSLMIDAGSGAARR